MPTKLHQNRHDEEWEMVDGILIITVNYWGELSVDYLNGEAASDHHYECAEFHLREKGVLWNG